MHCHGIRLVSEGQCVCWLPWRGQSIHLSVIDYVKCAKPVTRSSLVCSTTLTFADGAAFILENAHPPAVVRHVVALDGSAKDKSLTARARCTIIVTQRPRLSVGVLRVAMHARPRRLCNQRWQRSCQISKIKKQRVCTLRLNNLVAEWEVPDKLGSKNGQINKKADESLQLNWTVAGWWNETKEYKVSRQLRDHAVHVTSTQQVRNFPGTCRSMSTSSPSHLVWRSLEKTIRGTHSVPWIEWTFHVRFTFKEHCSDCHTTTDCHITLRIAQQVPTTTSRNLWLTCCFGFFELSKKF